MKILYSVFYHSAWYTNDRRSKFMKSVPTMSCFKENIYSVRLMGAPLFCSFFPKQLRLYSD